MEKVFYNISNSPPTQTVTTNADGTVSVMIVHVTTMTSRPWALPAALVIAAVLLFYILSLTRRNSRE